CDRSCCCCRRICHDPKERGQQAAETSYPPRAIIEFPDWNFARLRAGQNFWLPGMAFESITHTFFDIEIERLNSPEEVHLVKILSIDGRRFTYEVRAPLTEEA